MRNLKEETFYLASYFDSRMMGLDDNYQTSDPAEAEDWAWEHLTKGGYIQVKNQKTGKEVYLDPDDLLFDYDDYASGAFEDAINNSGVLEESIKESKSDCKYKVYSYFDPEMQHLHDEVCTDSADDAEAKAWSYFTLGNSVMIENQETGAQFEYTQDDRVGFYQGDDADGEKWEELLKYSGVFTDPEWHDTADQEQVDQADYTPDPFEMDFVMGNMDEDMGKEIKRYSDVLSDERRNQGWWYFTTHGIQPGSVPKGVHILEVRDTPNGTYFRTDAIYNTSELREYDIKERVPEDVMKEWERKRAQEEHDRDFNYFPDWNESLNRKSGKILTEAPNDEKEQGKKPAEDNAEVDPDKGSGDAEKEQKIKQKYLEFIKQLKSAKDYNSYLQLLRKICQDDNSRKILFWGIQKGIDGNGQNAVKGQVKVTALLPTQNEIGVNDSLAYPLEKDPSGIPKLFKNPVQVGPNPIVVFNDGARNYVLDGHHRWSQVYMFNPNATMSAFILKKGFATGPVGALKNLQLIIGAGTGSVPSSDANGINIYTAGEDQLKNWIAQRLKNSVGQRALEIFNKATSQQLDANGLLEYFMKNILTLKKTTGTWAKKMPPRSEMPQTNKGPDGVAGTVGYADNVVTESKKLREAEDDLSNFMDWTDSERINYIIANFEKITGQKIETIFNYDEDAFEGSIFNQDEVDKTSEAIMNFLLDNGMSERQVDDLLYDLDDRLALEFDKHIPSKKNESLNKKPANTKINIRESLNKYDLRTDNKYDLRNLYDACIMTDKEKRTIAEMISKNTRANVLYEALMRKFEGKSLNESLDQEQVEDTKAYVYEQATHRKNLTRDGHIEIDEYHFEDMVNDALDYEDCTEEEAQAICEEVKKLIEGIKYYKDSWKEYIELSDNHTLWDIDIPDGVSEAEVESVYEMTLGIAFDDFQEETGVDLTMLGRSGRHICVDNTYENAKRYSELVSVQKEVEDRFIQNVNNELRSPNEEEYESLKESKSLKESGFPYRSSGIDLERVIQDLWERGSADNLGEENWIEIFDQNEVGRLSNGEQYCSRIECTGNTGKRNFLSLQTDDWGLKYKFGFEDWKTAHSMDELWGEIVSRCNRQPEQESLKESKERKTKKFDSLEKARKFENSLPEEAEARMDYFDKEKKDGSVKEWWEVYYWQGKEESLKEAYGEEDEDEEYRRLRRTIKPVVDALHEFEGDMRDFRMTYNFGIDDTGSVTGGVDFDMAGDSRLSEDEIKSRFEEIFDENGFELDRRFKVNPGRTWLGSTHYQIIEKGDYTPTLTRDDMNAGQWYESLEEGKLNEEDGAMVTFDLNTDVVTSINPGMYGSAIEFPYEQAEDTPENYKMWDDIVVEQAIPYIEEAVQKTDSRIKVKNFKINHPRFYNFVSDCIDFDVELPQALLMELFEKYKNDQSFLSYLKDNYSSRDGFISTMANTPQEFQKQCEDAKWKSLSQILSYNAQDEFDDRQREFEDDVLDGSYWWEKLDCYEDEE